MENQLKKISSKHLVNDDCNKIVVSGTCNICAAPCSSCMHFGMKSSMDSKVEENFSEINLKKETDQFSCVNCEGEPICKCTLYDNGEHEASEGSNFSVISSHDLTENAESKTTVKIPDAYGTPKDVDVPTKVFLVHENVSADGMDIKMEDPHSVNTQCLLSSMSKTNFDFQSLSIQGGEKYVQGCRGDNLSFNSKLKREITGIDIDCLNLDSDLKHVQNSLVLTGDLPSKSSKKTHEIQTSLDVNDVAENSYRRSGEPNNNDESLMYSSGYNTENDGSSKQPHQSDCLQMNDNPQIRNSSCGGSGLGSEKIEENLNFQLQEKHHDISLKKEKNDLGTSKFPIVDGNKFTLSDFVDTQSDAGNRKSSSLKHQSISDNTKVSQEIAIELNDEDGKSVKNIANANNEKVPIELVKSNRNTDEKANAAIESKPSESSTEPHQVSENNSESDILEDVKVCDICGDAGREEALAICSRCSDGAEHIYCMRIMMTELPKGDWLCEECKFKEDSENKKMASSEKACKVSTGPIVDKKPKDFGNVIPSNDLSKLDKKSSTVTTVTPKNISKLDNKESTASQAGKEFQNSISASNIFLGKLEVTSTSAKELENKSQSGMPSGTINSTVEKSMCCESSLNSLGAVTAVKVRPSKVSGASKPLFVGNAPTSSGLKSSDIQAQIRSPQDIVTKSSNNLKPKKKYVTDSVSPKTKLLREANKIDSKREGIPLISKSESFKSTQTSHVHIDSTVKNQTYDARGLTHGKEKSVLERKKSFTDPPCVSSSLVPPTRTSCSKKEPKADVHDRNLCDLSETNIVISNKEGPEDAHGSVAIHKMKQQTPHLEKNDSSNESFNLEDQKQCRRNQSSCSTDKIFDRVTFPGSSQSCKPTSHDMKNKSISLGNTRQVNSSGKIVKCQRCNETGHATQSCSIDKIRCTALKPRGNRNMVNKPNRWKGIIEASISKGRIQNSSDQTERLSLSSASLKRILPVKDIMLDSSHSRNLTHLAGISSAQESFGKSTSNVNLIADKNEDKFKSVQPMNVAFSPRSNSISSSNLMTKAVLTKEASINISTSTILAVPKKQWIWQGCFEIHRSGNLCHLCDGVQAHISSFASPKVFDVTSSFPCNIHLEEVPCSIACPVQFRQKSFTDENIALFFYAVDSESYQKYYTKLVDNMLKNDLFLKGKLDGFELLIFPSNKLPEKSQCWNGFYYLWGVFKRNSVNYSERKPDSQKSDSQKLHDSSITLNANSVQQGGEESSTSDVQVKMDEETKSTRSMDLDKLPSCGTEKKGFGYDLNEEFQDDERLHDDEVLDHTSSLKKQRTCSFSDRKQIVDPVGCDADRLHFSDLNNCTISLESMQHSQENQSKFPQNVQASSVANSSRENKVPFLETFTVNSMQKLSGCENEKTKADVPFIELETVAVEDQPQENVVQREFVPSDARHGMTHNFLHPQLPAGSQASNDSLNKAMPWKQNITWSVDQSQRVNKKMKPTDYKSSESYFSPVNWASLTEPKQEKNVALPVAVPWNRDPSQYNDVLNLDPALSTKKSLSVVPSLVGNNHSDHSITLHSSSAEDYVSPSISLSLAAPLPKDNNLTKTEQQVMPEKHTSFVLFGKIIDA